MRRLKLTVILLFLLSAVLLAVSTVWTVMSEDRSLVEIDCSPIPLSVSVYEDDSQLLEGVTATDEKDGDLTDQIFVKEIGKSGQNGRTTVTYAVVDSDNHVATATRELYYTDYQGPQFSLSQALRYTVGSPIVIRDRIQAWDSVDGDISSQIRIFSEGITSNVAGIYPVTFEVTNSLGNTSQVTLDVVIEEKTSANKPRVYLNNYLIYLSEGDEFSASRYLDSVGGGSTNNVGVSMPENGFVPGVNVVTYTGLGGNGEVGTTLLYVIVE